MLLTKLSLLINHAYMKKIFLSGLAVVLGLGVSLVMAQGVQAADVTFDANTIVAPTGTLTTMYIASGSEAATVQVTGTQIVVTGIPVGGYLQLLSGPTLDNVLKVTAVTDTVSFTVDTANITGNNFFASFVMTGAGATADATVIWGMDVAGQSYKVYADGSSYSDLTSSSGADLTFTYTTDFSGSVTLTRGLNSGGGGGGGGGSGSGNSVNPPAATPAVPATPATPTVTPATPATPAVPASSSLLNPSDLNSVLAGMEVARDVTTENKYSPLVTSDLKQFGVTATSEQKSPMINFVTYGISTATKALGSGERRALLRDYLETVGRAEVIWSDVEKMADGQKPVNRNLKNEQAKVSQVLATFKTIVGHTPNFKNAKEDLAWNTLMYRIRFDRDLSKERAAIAVYKAKFGKNPSSTLSWAAVRALGYAL